MRVLNGIVLGDMFGRYTCHTQNGSSTVDYVLVSESIMDQILYFRVPNCIPTLSDTHCKLEWELPAKYKQGWWVCCSLYNVTGLRWNPKPITVVQQ